MGYEVLLADADGTLFDFHAGEKVALSSMLAKWGIPTDDEVIALYSRINQSHWKRLERGETTSQRLRVERFEDFLKAVGKEGDPASMCDDFIEALSMQRILIHGAEAFCREVSQKMPIYLVTNGISQVQRSRFHGCKIEPYLKDFVISGEIGHAKPDPYMLFKAMEMAGVTDPRRVVMLGDSITADIGAANNAGVDSVLFTEGKEAPKNHGATFVAQTLEKAAGFILGSPCRGFCP